MNRAQFIISSESGKFVPPYRRVIVFAPHPDDEVIGAFSLLTRFRAACFMVFVTDGAPLKLGKSRAPLRRRRQMESNNVVTDLCDPSLLIWTIAALANFLGLRHLGEFRVHLRSGFAQRDSIGSNPIPENHVFWRLCLRQSNSQSQRANRQIC